MPNFTLGVDLGQARDFTALVAVERIQRNTGREKFSYYFGHEVELEDLHVVRHIERLPLRTDYVDVVSRVAELTRTEEMRGRVEVVLDATGVGRGIVNMFHAAHRQGLLLRYPIAITITAGEHSHGWNVTKRDLISKVEALLSTDRLKIDPDIANRDLLRDELIAFRAKISKAGNDTYEALREKDHDDLVIATALGCWPHHITGTPRYINQKGELIYR